MRNVFELAGGSVTGRSHRLAGRNNQDAYAWVATNSCAVVVVCDGCSSGRQSEVGAGLGARLLTHALLRQAKHPLTQAADPQQADMMPLLLERVRRAVLARLRLLAGAMSEDLHAIVADYLLFTVVGALVTPAVTAFFSLGDGVLVVNEVEYALGPFADNAPPYLAYGLLDGRGCAMDEMLHFQVNALLPTEEMQSFLIGTDGVHDLAQTAARSMPGRDEPIGPLQQFWRDDGYFANPDAMRRRLAAVNRDFAALDRARGGMRRENGLLPDDTTLVVARRRAAAAVEEGG